MVSRAAVFLPRALGVVHARFNPLLRAIAEADAGTDGDASLPAGERVIALIYRLQPLRAPFPVAPRKMHWRSGPRSISRSEPAFCA